MNNDMQSINDFLAQQSQQDLLRFITCGSVDDGKSTLIGRLLWESQQLFDDQLEALQAESKRHGTQGQNIDFALLVDGLTAEREQGITIDVAYRFFASGHRKFIVADTPGHEQYTRNMVTGASTADAAILLIDARLGLLPQTRRHTFLVSLMGIRHVVLAVNKMDLVDFSVSTFNQIEKEFRVFASSLGFTSVTAVPVSALKGDNVVQPSVYTPWYSGPSLLGCLETIELSHTSSERLVFPVQGVIRPHADFRGFSGSVVEGSVRLGDQIRVTASGQQARVTEIITMNGLLPVAVTGDAVTLRLDGEIDISRGDILSLSGHPLETSDQFEAVLVWMHESAGMVGRQYDMKLANQWVSVSLTNLKYRFDIHALTHMAAKQLELNDIAVCTLASSKPVVFDRYEHSKVLGGFILVDRFSHATVAAGMIQHSLRRAQNVHQQALSVSRLDRERLNGHAGKVIWFTGLSGSGKSTLANALDVELHRRGMRTYILDGDNVRQGLNKDLGFTEADRVENIRRIAEVAKLMMDAGLVVMTAFISPFRREREMARELVGKDHFIEVYVSTPLAVCEERDVKGLYKKARQGKIPNMTGINSPYEEPEVADYVADGDRMKVEEIVRDLAGSCIDTAGINFKITDSV